MTKQDIIDSINEKSDKYVEEYIAESESTGNTPTLDGAVKNIDNHVLTWIKEATAKGGFSAADINDIRNKTRGRSIQKMSQSYKESMAKAPRKIDGVQPQAKNDIKEDVNSPIEKGKSYMKMALEDRIKSGVELGDFPNDKQAEAFIDETIDEAIEYYATDLADNSKIYIKGQLKKYKDTLLRTVYKPQSKTISVSKGNVQGSTQQKTESQSSQGSGIVSADKIPVAAGVSEWAKTNISFSGCDMVVSAEMKTTDGTRVSVTIGSLQTLSYSIYRQLSAVKNIGNINAKDYVGGPRTIAGSMVFTVLNQHWGAELLTKFSEAEGYKHSRKILMDEIAPVDITVSMANEYGIYSRLAIYGVRFFSEGQVMSINDIYTENTFQYVALNIDYLVDINVNTNSDKNENTDSSSAPDATTVSHPPVNDGGQKSGDNTGTGDNSDASVSKPRIEVGGSKIIGPDGEIMDLSKFETQAIAIAWVNEKKIGAEDKVQSMANGDKNKAKQLADEIQKRYVKALSDIYKYYGEKNKIPEEVAKN